MIGAIIGDIAGSRFEWHNSKTKEFEFFSDSCHLTDDSIMTLAIAKAILSTEQPLGSAAITSMQELGRQYPRAGYGRKFRRWLLTEQPEPYRSYGNGAAMRVSACGFAARSMDEALTMARVVTEVTHNHPEGIKGAQAVSSAIWMALRGHTREEIYRHINDTFYVMDFTLDEIRPTYTFHVSCQRSVPQAFQAFFESNGFEDTIRNAISIGGDSDTIAAIAGSVAGAYYGVPEELRAQALTYMDPCLIEILNQFEEIYGKERSL